jgi:phosphoglucosamine mutase
VAWLGWAAGQVLGRDAKQAAKRALIGHDGRRSGPGLEAAIARGLRAQGFEVKSAGLITTPGLAWLTRNHDFALGAMISASHNPSEDNGIKLFSDQGEKLSDASQDEIELLLESERSEIPAGEKTVHDGGLEMLYLNHLLERGAKDLSLDGVSIVLDCANGAGSRVAPRVLGRLGAQVHSIASEPDGDNINRECGSTHPEALQRAVLSNQAHIGIALDGDGDRCILVDERGQIVHGDGIMTVIGRQAMIKGELKDARIVATVMSNRGLHRALREVGVGVVEVGVGDRQVVEKLRSEQLVLGGEQSGHIVLGAENDFIGDGVFTALRVLSVMRATGSSLSTANPS